MDEVDEVAVVVAELVRRVQAGAGLRGDAEDHRQRHPADGARGLEDDAEVLALDPLHDEVEDVVLLAEVEDLRHVGVADARRDAGLVEEHLLEVRIVGDVGQHRLDGDELLEAAGAHQARGPHRGHPAAGDRRQDLVATERARRADLVDGRRGFAARHRVGRGRVVGERAAGLVVRARAGLRDDGRGGRGVVGDRRRRLDADRRGRRLVRLRGRRDEHGRRAARGLPRRRGRHGRSGLGRSHLHGCGRRLAVRADVDVEAVVEGPPRSRTRAAPAAAWAGRAGRARASASRSRARPPSAPRASAPPCRAASACGPRPAWPRASALPPWPRRASAPRPWRARASASPPWGRGLGRFDLGGRGLRRLHLGLGGLRCPDLGGRRLRRLDLGLERLRRLDLDVDGLGRRGALAFFVGHARRVWIGARGGGTDGGVPQACRSGRGARRWPCQRASRLARPPRRAWRPAPRRPRRRPGARPRPGSGASDRARGPW